MVKCDYSLIVFTGRGRGQSGHGEYFSNREPLVGRSMGQWYVMPSTGHLRNEEFLPNYVLDTDLQTQRSVDSWSILLRLANLGDGDFMFMFHERHRHVCLCVDLGNKHGIRETKKRHSNEIWARGCLSLAGLLKLVAIVCLGCDPMSCQQWRRFGVDYLRRICSKTQQLHNLAKSAMMLGKVGYSNGDTCKHLLDSRPI